VFDDVGEAWGGEQVFPEVGGFVPPRSIGLKVRGVALAVVMAFVEGKEVGIGPIQFGGHPHFIGIYR
jgi:hypothetical protein